MIKNKFSTTISLDKAVKLINDTCIQYNIDKLPSETIQVKNALHRITAQPVFAKYSSPTYHSAAMDGYAVRFIDTFGASEVNPIRLKIGVDAIAIDTGDPIPDGFNAVIMYEDVNIIDNQIEIYEAVTPYSNVRVIGEDIVTTELIIPQNHRVRPVDMAAMLASGVLNIQVRRKPIVTIIPTGSEMRHPDEFANRMPNPPELIEYNSIMLSGMLNELGAEVKITEIIPDNLNFLIETISKAVENSDLVLVIAGSGKGSEDFTHTAVTTLGKVIFHGVSIKPGKPAMFSIIKSRPIIGIPGYPVSAYITFQYFVLPILEIFQSISLQNNETVNALISRNISSKMGIDEFVRVKLGKVNNNLIATAISRGAGLMMSLVRADGILKIPYNTEALTASSSVSVQLIKHSSDIEKTIVCIGSHDNALDVLANCIKKNHPKFSLSSAHVGSIGGLIAIKKGEAHIAGTHLLDETSGEYNIPFIKKLLSGLPVVLIHLVCRTQGLIIKKNNPKGISNLYDLLRNDITFINRQIGSGTRLLFDKCLKDLSISPSNIKGYEHEEYTHMAVASAVATSVADVGLGTLSAALALDLDFIPVANEKYDILMTKYFFSSDMGVALLDTIRSVEFVNAIQSLGGYDTTAIGSISYESN